MSPVRTRVRRVLARDQQADTTRPLPSRGSPVDTRVVVAVALVCVLAQLAVRAWALYGGYFYFDDYVLLRDARGRQVSADYLLTAVAGHLSPGGRLLMSWVAATGPLDWGLAATATLVVQGAAGVAASWALFVTFGRRWAVLVPLNLYLWSAVTVPGMMWLSGAIFLVPQQLSFWLAVGCWVQHLRTRSARWLLLSVLSLALGLTFDVKSLLTVVVLAFLTLGWFSDGPPRRRLLLATRRYWVGAAVLTAAVAAYLVLYLSRGGAPLRLTGPRALGELASSMLGTAFATAAVGGPWRWTTANAPAVYADPPAWSQHLAWVVLAAVVAAGWLLRRRTLRAWALLATYLVILLLLLAASRGADFGDVVGGELRYVTDAAMVLALCVGLAFLPVRGAAGSSAARTDPRLLLDLRRAGVVLTAVVCIGALVSTLRYVHVWHTENASVQWVDNLRSDVRSLGPVDLVDATLPADVQSPLLLDDNAVSDLAPLVSDEVDFPGSSAALLVVGDDGHLRWADIQLGLTSQPGPRPGCGWLVRGDGADVPLTSLAFRWTWWLRIGYLADRATPVTVVAGDSRVETTALAGLNNLYVRVDGSFSSVRLEGLAPGASMCVDTIETGQPVAGQAAVR